MRLYGWLAGWFGSGKVGQKQKQVKWTWLKPVMDAIWRAYEFVLRPCRTPQLPGLGQVSKNGL
jgi:hypothetical protein